MGTPEKIAEGLPGDRLAGPDGQRCEDCGGYHTTVLEALVCDQFTDAHHRRLAARRHRRAALGLDPETP